LTHNLIAALTIDLIALELALDIALRALAELPHDALRLLTPHLDVVPLCLALPLAIDLTILRSGEAEYSILCAAWCALQLWILAEIPDEGD
jgi:hypothetical protein